MRNEEGRTKNEEVSARRVLKDTASHKASPLGQGLRPDEERRTSFLTSPYDLSIWTELK